MMNLFRRELQIFLTSAIVMIAVTGIAEAITIGSNIFADGTLSALGKTVLGNPQLSGNILSAADGGGGSIADNEGDGSKFDGGGSSVAIGTTKRVSTGAALVDALADSNISRVIAEAGTYNITSTIRLAGPKILEGVGDATVFYLADGTNADVIRISGNGGVVRNLKIDGNRANNHRSYWSGIYGNEVSGWTFEKLTIVNVKGGPGTSYQGGNNQAGLSLINSESCRVLFCNISGSTFKNLAIYGEHTDPALYGRHQIVGGKYTRSGGAAIGVMDSADSSIDSVYINMERANINGMNIGTKVKVINSTIKNCGTTGIVVGHAGPSYTDGSYSQISHCTIIHTGSSAIDAEGWSGHGITGVIIDHNTIHADRGIFLNYGSDCVIDNNHLTSIRSEGISVNLGLATGGAATGRNQIRGNTIIADAGKTINLIDVNDTNTNISNNYLENGEIGIFLRGSRCHVTSNQFVNNTYGVRVHGDAGKLHVIKGNGYR